MSIEVVRSAKNKEFNLSTSDLSIGEAYLDSEGDLLIVTSTSDHPFNREPIAWYVEEGEFYEMDTLGHLGFKNINITIHLEE